MYGRHPVREALRGQRDVRVVHATPATLHAFGSELPDGLRIEEASATRLAELVGTDDHQGIVAEVGSFPYAAPHELFDGVDAPFVLCLDQVTDPHNLGAISRVADASGATGILIPEHRSAVVTAAVCKASAGAVEHVRIARCTNLADSIQQAKSAAVWAYGASERGERLYTDVDLGGGVLIVLGSEGAGLRPRVAGSCDELVRIPMQGSVSSLNVATVAALLAFEVVRQRGGL